MTLPHPNVKDDIQTVTPSRDISPCNGDCAHCVDGCHGNCEIFKAAFRGRELISPTSFGEIVAAGNKNYPVDYSHLNIHGYALGAKGLPSSMEANPDNAKFPNVNTETEYGWGIKVKMALPIFTDAIGFNEFARKYWEHFAIGAAISGIAIVCGDNVCGVDPALVLNGQKKVINSPDMDRRIACYRRYYNGMGEILVQMNVEDTRLGVAEYLIDKHGLDTIELKWGQGAKCIGNGIKLNCWERALELQHRGYIISPDPSDPVNQAAFKHGALCKFECHSRLGFVDEEAFYREIYRLRKLGYKRITLKTGAFGLRELAMAIKWGAKAKIDLLTIDGSPGSTGMSSYRMMEEWGMPPLYLHAAAYEFANKLQNKGEAVPDLAFAGGFSSEYDVFKALSLGAPFVRAVCLGQALIIPGIVGKNIDQWLQEGNLPESIREFGTTKEEIFVCYERVKNLVGAREIEKIPLGAIGIYSFVDKIKVGLQQLMAGARCFNITSITRNDLMSLTEECAKVTGIPYLMDSYRAEAEEILNG